MDVVGFEFRGFGWSLPIFNGLQGSLCLLLVPAQDLLTLRVHFATADDINPALPERTLSYGNCGIVLMQDLYHQPYHRLSRTSSQQHSELF